MRRKDIQLLVFFMAIWIALNETIAPFSLFVGVVVCWISIRFTNNFMKMDYAAEFFVSPATFIKYSLYLVKEIYLAGYDMLKRIVTGDVHPVFMDYKSGLKRELSNVILANSITSTPGTITIHRVKNEFVILSANADEASVLGGVRDGMELHVRDFEEEGK